MCNKHALILTLCSAQLMRHKCTITTAGSVLRGKAKHRTRSRSSVTSVVKPCLLKYPTALLSA